MGEVLIWTLTANLASMGELAGNEYRPSMRYPGRSIVLGIMGAALGIERDDLAGQEKLSALEAAVAIFDDGTSLRDYHTVQTIGRKCRHDAYSYRDAHAHAERGHLFTTPTYREYRSEVHYGVAIWNGKPDENREIGKEPIVPITLDEIRNALKQPVYSMFLGRKSCSLSSPVAARIVETDSLETAFRHLPNPVWMRKPAIAQEMVIDADYARNSGFVGMWEWRHDIPLSRTRREFGSREVCVVPVDIQLGEIV